MEPNAPSAKKRIVESLTFGAKTAKRVAWEAWSFTVVGPLQVAVTNDSYGYLADDHTYTVTVEDRDGLPVPAECACPADRYNEEYDCKHKVSLATVGGPVVLEAAREYETPTDSDATDAPARTLADKLATDGGPIGEHSDPTDGAGSPTVPCPNGQPGCPGPDGDDLPCFDCYRPTEEA